MPRYRVYVTGKKLVETAYHAPLPPLASPYAMQARPSFEMVELVFPHACPCCGGEVEESSYLEVSKVKGWGGYTPATLDNWQVPYCRACLEHLTLKQHRPISSNVIEIVMILSGMIAVFSLVKTNAVLGAILFLGILIAGIAGNTWILRRYEHDKVRPAMKADCIAPLPAITYQGWNSDSTRHHFLILSHSYAKDFAQINHSQTIIPVK